MKLIFNICLIVLIAIYTFLFQYIMEIMLFIFTFPKGPDGSDGNSVVVSSIYGILAILFVTFLYYSTMEFNRKVIKDTSKRQKMISLIFVAAASIFVAYRFSLFI